MTLVGSRFTHFAESRYAPVEGEALAVAEALDRARHFVLGCSDLIVAVDHKPLLKLFSDRCLEDIPNPRLRNLKECSLRYRFRMVYVPGTRNLASDALSRHPSGSRTPHRLHLQGDHQGPGKDCPNQSPTQTGEVQTSQQSEEGGLQTALCSALDSSTISWEQLQTATIEDPALQDLVMAIEEGTPSSKEDLPHCIQAYFRLWNSLSDDVVCYGRPLVIPQQLRGQCLSALHSAHQGVSSMTARAVSTLYWPGITADPRPVPSEQWNRPIPTAPTPHHTRNPKPSIQRRMCRLFPPCRIPIPGRGGQTIWMANCDPRCQRGKWPGQRTPRDVCCLRDPGHNHN